jgi:hypothetical protein
VLKVYSHIGTRFGQRYRSRPPNATAAAGDKGRSSSQFIFHIPGESLLDGARAVSPWWPISSRDGHETVFKSAPEFAEMPMCR